MPYVVRRLALMIPTLVGVTVLASLILRLLPGSALELLAAEQGANTTETALIEQRLGLDRPWVTQYGTWAAGLFRGDLGTSLVGERPIADEVRRRLPVTLEMGALGLIFASAMAIPLGVISAVRQNTALDYVTRSLAIAALALPGFWLGTLIMVWPAVWWDWSPTLAYVDLWVDPVANLKQMWIPSALLGVYLVGFEMRLTRTMMLEVLRQDYMRTARAKGLSSRAVVIQHGLKNALIPVLTLVGLQVPFVIGSAVVFEQIFAIPGIGSLLLEALSRRDFPIIQAINFVMAVVVLMTNLVIDITYPLIDPRIRYD